MKMLKYYFFIIPIACFIFLFAIYQIITMNKIKINSQLNTVVMDLRQITPIKKDQKFGIIVSNDLKNEQPPIKQPELTKENIQNKPEPVIENIFERGSFDVQKVGDEPDLRNLAITVAKVSRTQLASFAGNLLVVFPLTYLLAMFFWL